MKHNWIRITLYVSFVFFLAACNPAGTSNLPENTALPIPAVEQTREAQTGTVSPSEEKSQMTPSLPTPESTNMQNLVEKAKEDLAQRLSIAITQISLVEARGVVWPDASMGCPQPGMAYIQVPQDGALIVLQVEGKTYEYHSGGNRGLFLCEKSTKEPALPQLDIQNLTPTSRDKDNPAASTPDNGIPPGEGQ